MGARDTYARLLAAEDHDGLRAEARGSVMRVVRYVIGRLYSEDEAQKMRAVRALGALLGDRDLVDDARARDLLRRFLWSLAEESGNVPFGVPEAMGEVLVRRPELQADFLGPVVATLTCEELSQTGPILRGVYWAVARVGRPVADRHPDAAEVVREAARSHEDPAIRALANEAVARFG